MGQEILPTFLSVTDDPTLKELDGVKLSGTYEYDNEGVPAQRVVLVDHGILKDYSKAIAGQVERLTEIFTI